ncbi:MAG: LemA family protein [Flavobacteriales bacterium]|nr:LemA family protein [Flavobacteriales bacterium]MCB9193928.1 LemA family protein [Flavobacteriales bacterium]
MKNKGVWITLGIVALLAIYLGSTFNRMKKAEIAVNAQWGQVEVAYQARADKTKNLVEIVKGSADFEKSTLTDVIEARSKASSINLSGDNLTPENIKAFEAAQAQFTGALSRLMVTVERYPDLKTTQAFRDFQAQYEGMENRIAVERRKFNDSVGTYTAMIETFPGNMFASLFGFKPKGFFEAKEGSENAPDISFK